MKGIYIMVKLPLNFVGVGSISWLNICKVVPKFVGGGGGGGDLYCG